MNAFHILIHTCAFNRSLVIHWLAAAYMQTYSVIQTYSVEMMSHDMQALPEVLIYEDRFPHVSTWSLSDEHVCDNSARVLMLDGQSIIPSYPLGERNACITVLFSFRPSKSNINSANWVSEDQTQFKLGQNGAALSKKIQQENHLRT